MCRCAGRVDSARSPCNAHDLHGIVAGHMARAGFFFIALIALLHTHAAPLPPTTPNPRHAKLPTPRSPVPPGVTVVCHTGVSSMLFHSVTSVLIATELSTTIHRLRARSTLVRAPLLPAQPCLPFAAPGCTTLAHTCRSAPRNHSLRASACARSLKVPDHLIFEGRAAPPAAAASSSEAAATSDRPEARWLGWARAGSQPRGGRRFGPRWPVTAPAVLAAPHAWRGAAGRSRRRPKCAQPTRRTLLVLCALVGDSTRSTLPPMDVVFFDPVVPRFTGIVCCRMDA